MKITVLGTGLMGAPMARNLAAAGHQVTVWNRNAAKAEALSSIASVAPSPQDACQGADVVLSMLLDGPVTAEVLDAGGVMAAAAPNALVLDMGSVDPGTDIALADKAVALGLRFLDAPVSGGVVGAEAATLAIFVGGTASDFAAAAPILKVLGRPSLLGAVGSGQIAKLANQLIVAITIGAVAEGLRLAESSGCDPAALRDALRGGFADSRILDLHGERMVTGNFIPGGRSIAQLKDIDNALAVAADKSIDLPLSDRVRGAFYDFVHNHDGAEMDHSAYYLWLKRKANR